jgi:hypothetical protein
MFFAWLSVFIHNSQIYFVWGWMGRKHCSAFGEDQLSFSPFIRQHACPGFCKITYSVEFPVNTGSFLEVVKPVLFVKELAGCRIL